MYVIFSPQVLYKRLEANMKTFLTITIALGLLVTLISHQSAHAQHSKPTCQRCAPYDYQSGRYYNAAAFRRLVPHDYCGYREYIGCKDLAWRYPRHFIPVCEVQCTFDSLGNPYNCHTVCY